MEWKMSAKNEYPNIILSDCIVDGIQIDNQNIIMKFSESGIVIKESSNSKYYRTRAAQIILENCDMDEVLIKFVYKKKGIIKTKADILKDMKLDTFFQNISTAKWHFEIVEEFYSDLGGIYIGKVRKQKVSFWCYIKIYFENIIYFWDEVDYRYDIN